MDRPIAWKATCKKLGELVVTVHYLLRPCFTIILLDEACLSVIALKGTQKTPPCAGEILCSKISTNINTVTTVQNVLVVVIPSVTVIVVCVLITNKCYNVN